MLDGKTISWIIVLRSRGLSYLAIARELKLTKGQVAGVLFRAGLTKVVPLKEVSNA